MRPSGGGLSGNFKATPVSLSLITPADVRSGFLDVTAVSEAQRNAILARKLSPERIQPRHTNSPHLRQFTVHQVENQATLYYVLNQLQGTAQPYVAYTPEAAG
ncbi:MAG: hypothetical protein AMXMBFR33_28650 [Candidatus Xenobia bacterium]